MKRSKQGALAKVKELKIKVIWNKILAVSVYLKISPSFNKHSVTKYKFGDTQILQIECGLW